MSTPLHQAFGQIIARAWQDEAFLAELLAHPEAIFAQYGIQVPEGMTIKVLADDAATTHFVVPMRPADLCPVALQT